MTLHVIPENSTPALSRGSHFCFHTGYQGTPFANEDGFQGPADGSIPVLHANDGLAQVGDKFNL